MYTLLHSVPPTLQQATADSHLHWILLDTHGHVWVSFLWGHCSFLLGPGTHKVLFVPSKSLLPQSCVSSGSPMVGLMATSSKRFMPYPGLLDPEPLPLLTHTSTGDTQTQFWFSLGGLGMRFVPFPGVYLITHKTTLSMSCFLLLPMISPG